MPTRLLVATLLSALVSACAMAKSFVYISVAGEKQIAVYHLAEETGAISLHHSIQVSGQPGALALDPSRQYLFASIRSSGSLASFAINDDGALKLINELSAGADPSYIAVDRSGRFLLSAYYRAGKVTVHEITESGRIGNQVQSIETDEKAHSIVADPSNRFWFVPHTGPNAIFQFQLDPANGSLSPSDPPKLVRQAKAGPRHLWFHPKAAIAYSSDEQGRSVSAYRLDERRGTLELLQSLSTLPADADREQKGSTSDIEVDPRGRFVYVANRGHDSIAQFAVSADTSLLRHVGNTPTEETTRSFNIDPSGKYLIAAGQRSGKAAVFRIDAANGDLERLHTIEVGAAPWWVLVR